MMDGVSRLLLEFLGAEEDGVSCGTSPINLPKFVLAIPCLCLHTFLSAILRFSKTLNYDERTPYTERLQRNQPT